MSWVAPSSTAVLASAPLPWTTSSPQNPFLTRCAPSCSCPSHADSRAHSLDYRKEGRCHFLFRKSTSRLRTTSSSSTTSWVRTPVVEVSSPRRVSWSHSSAPPFCHTASGTTIRALMNLIDQAGAKLVGIGALVEKSFEVQCDLLPTLLASYLTHLPTHAPTGRSRTPFQAHGGANRVLGCDRRHGGRCHHFCAPSRHAINVVCRTLPPTSTSRNGHEKGRQEQEVTIFLFDLFIFRFIDSDRMRMSSRLCTSQSLFFASPLA